MYEWNVSFGSTAPHPSHSRPPQASAESPSLSLTKSYLPDEALNDAEEDGGEERPCSEVVRDEIRSPLASHRAYEPEVILTVSDEERGDEGAV